MCVAGSFTYYRNTLLYEGGSAVPTKIFHPEGFVAFSGTLTTPGEWTYKYYKTDHLGNVRALLAVDNETLVEEQHADYYPFGLVHDRFENLHLNRMLYSGKELQDAAIGTNGQLGWYDFGARHYDPLTGHWMTQDLLKQFANPYLYCANNPNNFIDRLGLYGSRPPVEDKYLYGFYTTIENDVVTVYGFRIRMQYDYDGYFFELKQQMLKLSVPGSPAWDVRELIETGGELPAAGLSIGYGAMGDLKFNDKFWLGKNGKFYSQQTLKQTETGKYVRGVQGYRNSAQLAKATAQKLQKLSRTAGYLGVGFETYFALEDGRLSVGDLIKIGILTASVITPYGWVYGIVDLGVGIITGESLTNRIGNWIDY